VAAEAVLAQAAIRNLTSLAKMDRMTTNSSNRWLIAAAGVVMQLALGAVCAWSVFRIPLTKSYGGTVSQVTLAFELATRNAAPFVAEESGSDSFSWVSGLSARDAEPFHLGDQCCAWQPESGGRTFRTSDHPASFSQCLDDMFALGIP
jgi:hypothetical protein